MTILLAGSLAALWLEYMFEVSTLERENDYSTLHATENLKKTVLIFSLDPFLKSSEWF